jgi:predicted Fe-Mo cluster-binding NifX family protein
MNGNPVKIAIPLQDGRVSGHFGHPDFFSLVTVDSSSSEILGEALRTPPPHGHGRLPLWLAEQGVDVVLASGIGHKAVSRLESRGIEVRSGVPQLSTSKVVKLWLDGKLQARAGTCSHGAGGRGHGSHGCGRHD